MLQAEIRGGSARSCIDSEGWLGLRIILDVEAPGFADVLVMQDVREIE